MSTAWAVATIVAAVLALIVVFALGMEIGQARAEKVERRHWHNQLTALYRSIVVHQQVGTASDAAEPVKQVIKGWLDQDPDALAEMELADKWEEPK